MSQVYLTNVNDYFYFIERKNEQFDESQVEESKIIGYLDLASDRSDLELKRYFRNSKSIWDHFYCTGQKDSILDQLNYIEEPKDFTGKFLLSKAGVDINPLFVYANSTELDLFSIPNLEKDLKLESVRQIIESNMESNARFWWINDGEKDWAHLNPTFEKFHFSINEIDNDEIKLGDLLIVSNTHEGKLEGVFEFTKYLESAIEANYIYEFKNKIEVIQLASNKLLDKWGIGDALLQDAVNIPANVFNEIIKSTEIGSLIKESQNQDITDKAQVTNDSIPFHLDQVEKQID